MNPDDHKLSEEGLRRHDLMLQSLLDEVDRTRSTRRVRRRIAVGACGMVLMLAVFRFGIPGAPPDLVERSPVEVSPDPSGDSYVEGGGDMESPQTEDVDGLDPVRRSLVQRVHDRTLRRITMVPSDPHVVDRYAVDFPLMDIRRLDDDGLLSTLVSIDRPAGLIRIGNRVRLSRPVSDAELARGDSQSFGQIR